MQKLIKYVLCHLLMCVKAALLKRMRYQRTLKYQKLDVTLSNATHHNALTYGALYYNSCIALLHWGATDACYVHYYEFCAR